MGDGVPVTSLKIPSLASLTPSHSYPMSVLLCCMPGCMPVSPRVSLDPSPSICMACMHLQFSKIFCIYRHLPPISHLPYCSVSRSWVYLVNLEYQIHSHPCTPPPLTHTTCCLAGVQTLMTDQTSAVQKFNRWCAMYLLPSFMLHIYTLKVRSNITCIGYFKAFYFSSWTSKHVFTCDKHWDIPSEMEFPIVFIPFFGQSVMQFYTYNITLF